MPDAEFFPLAQQEGRRRRRLIEKRERESPPSQKVLLNLTVIGGGKDNQIPFTHPKEKKKKGGLCVEEPAIVNSSMGAQEKEGYGTLLSSFLT